MKRVEVLFFKIGTCGSCVVVEEIFTGLMKRINDFFGTAAIELKTYDLEDEEGYRIANQLSISSAPTLVIQGNRFTGKAINDELLEAEGMLQ